MKTLHQDLKKILKITALGALTISATIASGYQVQRNIGTVPVLANTVEKATVEEIRVTVEGKGALYITKENDIIWFWLLTGNDSKAEVYLYDQVDLNNIVNPTLINIGIDGISSIFYSDNLLQVNNNIQFSIKGTFREGKIILPLDQNKYEPLFQVIQEEPKPIGKFLGMDELFLTQMDIYNQVDIVAVSQDDQKEIFVEKTNLLLESYSQSVLDMGENLQQILNTTEAKVLDMVDTAIAQVDSDMQQVAVAQEEMNTYIVETNKIRKLYLPCIETGGDILEADLQDFENFSDRYEEEKEGEDPLEDELDEISEQQEDQNDILSNDITNCVGTEEQIEEMASYEFSINIPETGNYQEIEASELNFVQVELEAASMGQDFSDRGLVFSDSANAIVDIESLKIIEHSFDQWISRAYLEENLLSSGNKKSIESSDELLSDVNLAQLKGQEVLCEDFTDFVIEFNVAGIGVVIGTPFDDRIKTGNEHNLVITFKGDDCIETHDGVDFVFAGPGEDKIFGGDHHDFLVGGKDNDEIHGSAGKTYNWGTGNVDIGNVILGAGGDDSLYGGEDNADKGEDGTVETNGYTDIILGDLWFTGEPGADMIDGERGIDFIFGEQGNDTLKNDFTGAINIYGVNFKLGSFFFAGDGNDSISGSNSTGAGLTQLLGDFIFGSEGNDTANGKGGMDFIFGGRGNDTLSGGNFTDLVFGNKDNDLVKGDDGIDLVSGDTGSDTVYGNNGAFDLLLGGQDSDKMYGGNGVDLIFGSQGNDAIEGNDSVDLIFAGDGADIVRGGNSVDLLFGSKGADQIFGDAGVDIIFGGADGDTIEGGASTDIIFGNTNRKGVDILRGGDGVDIIFGNSGTDVIYGGDDTDIIFGNSEDDRIFGGRGVDIIFGNSGNDTIFGEADTDIIFGNTGNDNMSGGGSTDVMFGNEGCDIIKGDDSTDILFGNSGADIIRAGSGTDVVFGNSGNDMIYGESGTDVLFGNSDNDYINSGSGTNIVFGNSGNDHIVGGDDKDFIWGNRGNDYIAGHGDRDLIFGNRGNDLIDGGSSKDIIFGNRDNDTINAGSGTDWIWANRGNDKVRGVEGRNRVWGNRGDDTLDGYIPGSDTRDKLRGNRHSDTLTGNSSNSRDRLRGGAGSDHKHRNITLVPISLFNEPTYQMDACLQQ